MFATRSCSYLVSSLPLLPPLSLFYGAYWTLHQWLLQDWAGACLRLQCCWPHFPQKHTWLVEMRWRRHKKKEAYSCPEHQELGPNGCAEEVEACSPSPSAATPESSTDPAAASVTAAQSCHSRQGIQATMSAVKKHLKSPWPSTYLPWSTLYDHKRSHSTTDTNSIILL